MSSVKKVTGSLTAQNLNAATGVPTAGSVVVMTVGSLSSLAIQVAGTYTGALSVQARNNKTNWITLGGGQVFNVNTATGNTNISTGLQGIFQVDVSGFDEVRLTPLSAFSGKADITLRATDAESVVSISGGTINATATMTSTTLAAPSSTIAGLTERKVLAAATTNATSVKTSAARLLAYQFTNLSASPRFIKFYNKASAPVPGTDTPIFTVAVPAGQNIDNALPYGLTFSLGLAFAITAAVADNDATVIAANDVVGSLHYV